MEPCQPRSEFLTLLSQTKPCSRTWTNSHCKASPSFTTGRSLVKNLLQGQPRSEFLTLLSQTQTEFDQKSTTGSTPLEDTGLFLYCSRHCTASVLNYLNISFNPLTGSRGPRITAPWSMNSLGRSLSESAQSALRKSRAWYRPPGHFFTLRPHTN